MLNARVFSARIGVSTASTRTRERRDKHSFGRPRHRVPGRSPSSACCASCACPHCSGSDTPTRRPECCPASRPALRPEPVARIPALELSLSRRPLPCWACAVVPRHGGFSCRPAAAAAARLAATDPPTLHLLPCKSARLLWLPLPFSFFTSSLTLDRVPCVCCILRAIAPSKANQHRLPCARSLAAPEGRLGIERSNRH
ncbi:hypothetical protein BS50DRAFT_4061 [Corynespora cassiicola Philippines]|uniref:Uncharacterized protein n=1 Tax=Corynespora cassiicola Philippines TaxID=1448308 RepID=A0A2T2P8F0_CORCC|nr:hypothetical protein BS50DRAFT_4061 [Corynespora cassiicola Philippines]